MKEATFAELLGSMNEALEHAKGKRDLRTTTGPLPPKPLDGRAVKRVRAALRASQAVFARQLNVSTKLVQAWEAGQRTPQGPALVLLHIVAKQPGLIDAVGLHSRTAGPAKTRGRSRTNPRKSTAA